MCLKTSVQKKKKLIYDNDCIESRTQNNIVVFLIISHRSLSFGNLKKCSSLCRLLLLLQPKAEQKWPVCLIFSSTRWLHLDRVNPATRGPCRFKFQNGAPLKSYQVKRLGYQGLWTNYSQWRWCALN